ncbi:MAG: hypothetical protein FIA95_10340 [Gemmatimonadetes bacterium]|nr:hypothetical protein [Gemmatimonadota bacterium]
MTDKYLEHDDLDGLIIRELSRLPSFEPSRGFSDRVMAQVRLPDPKAVVALRRARAWVLQPRRALALAGAYAACAIVALGLAVPWVLQHSPDLSYSASLLGERILTAAREAGMAAAARVFASPSWETLRSLPLLREHLVPFLALLSVAYAGAAVALHRLLKTPGGKRVPVTR